MYWQYTNHTTVHHTVLDAFNLDGHTNVALVILLFNYSYTSIMVTLYHVKLRVYHYKNDR